MDGELLACPVCTLYLREGMSMQSHLNTHPKDQVIDALVRLYTPPSRSYGPQAYTPPAIVNPFQVVSEEHTLFLGRQQVITNTIHAPFMGYPVYPNQQILGTTSEYSQSEIQLNVSAQDSSGIVTTVVNYSNDDMYNREAIEDSNEEGQKLVIQETAGQYEPIKHSEEFQVKTNDNEDDEQIPECNSPSSHRSDNSDEDGGQNDDMVNMDEAEPESHDPEYITNEIMDQDTKTESVDDLNEGDMKSQVQEYIANEIMDQDAKTQSGEDLNDGEMSTCGINIEANEKMPARGELSGQESLGNTVSSLWLPEGDVTSEHIWTERTDDSKKKYPCLYCSEELSCPKERRVHVATLHCGPPVNDTKVFSKQVMCLKCGFHLPSQKELKVHMKAEHKRISRQCNVCGQDFPTQELYQEHLTKIHPLECRTCGKTFHTKSSLYVHTKIHMTHKPYACTLCPKTFITNQKLKEHMNGHTGYAPYQCNLCERKFKRYSNLKQHKNQAHLQIKKKSKEYFCECGETFPTKKKLDWHKETHSTKPKQCMYCSERYIHAASLTRHIRKAHDNHFLPKNENGVKKKNVICPVCKQVFMEASLKIHLKQHTSPKQYGCIVCGKRFLTKWNLHLHRWTHASRMSKPFKCSLCKGAFVRHTDLQAHMRTHFGNKPFTCNHCGRQFNRKHNWHRHEKEHTQEKNYSCAECGKTFHRSYYLREHLRIHTGVKPFSCHICNKSSSTKSNHNKHVKTHHAREAINSES